MLCDVCRFWFSEEVQISIHAEPAQSHVINDLLMQGSECMSRFGKDRKWGPLVIHKTPRKLYRQDCLQDISPRLGIL